MNCLVKEVPKSWGKEVWMANTELYCGKLLILEKGKSCSLHLHKIKDETFYIYSGKVLMKIEEGGRVMNAGDAVLIKPETKHKFTGLENSVIIEISTHHEDSDSYRIKS